jgi:hypothetical protein
MDFAAGNRIQQAQFVPRIAYGAARNQFRAA